MIDLEVKVIKERTGGFSVEDIDLFEGKSFRFGDEEVSNNPRHVSKKLRNLFTMRARLT